MMWVDPDRARQILLNLVMNAVKYATAAGEQITLSFAAMPDAVSVAVAERASMTRTPIHVSARTSMTRTSSIRRASP
jgi:signal transduction histidine kinase